MIALAQLLALGACLVALAAALSARAAREPLGRAIAALPPALQVVAIEALLAAPWIAPIVVVALALAPSGLALVWPAFDHCGAHGDHHAHLCLAHPPHHALLGGWAVLAVAAAALGVTLGRAVFAELRAHHDARSLALRASAGDRFSIVPTPRVFCAVAGALAPVVLVSEGALRALDAETLAIALAHERAHARRRDVARQSLARILASIHVDPSGWLERLAIARERACDEEAATRHDRLDVADALVRCARAMDAELPAGVLAFGPLVLEARVVALLDDPVAAPDRARVLLGALAIALATLAGAPFVHHALETVLGAVAH